MPLSPAAPREPLHTRQIAIQGYRRADGRFDIEARLTDTKSFAFENLDRGVIEPGEALHGMELRLTIDEDAVIIACEAAMDYTPYTICPGAAPNFARLAGLKVAPGFLRLAHARVAGVEGCTHLRELLQQIATTAFQTLYLVRKAKHGAQTGAPLVNTCFAYSDTGPVVARQWPELAR